MSKILHPTIYKDDSIELFLETDKYWGVFMHCYVYKWSRSTLREFRVLWDEVLDQLETKGLSTVHVAIKLHDHKLERFTALFGFSSTGVILKDNKGDERMIYQCLT